MARAIQSLHRPTKLLFVREQRLGRMRPSQLNLVEIISKGLDRTTRGGPEQPSAIGSMINYKNVSAKVDLRISQVITLVRKMLFSPGFIPLRIWGHFAG
jgi:hypothetical protein